MRQGEIFGRNALEEALVHAHMLMCMHALEEALVHAHMLMYMHALEEALVHWKKPREQELQRARLILARHPLCTHGECRGSTL